jgi:hypothetical protein
LAARNPFLNPVLLVLLSCIHAGTGDILRPHERRTET